MTLDIWPSPKLNFNHFIELGACPNFDGHEAVECQITVTTCKWFASASITVAARGLEKGF